MGKHFGATPNEWVHFELLLGLGADMLPVVSNPNARVSETSKLRDIGKVPSVYNGSGEIIGLAKWPQKIATPAEVSRWSKQPDYGICLQTRRVRAIDIDVDDVEKALRIRHIISQFLGFTPPLRYRANSGKCLFALIVEGELPKRVIKVDGGAIEFLANGQQFIAAGTHKSGVRYEWDWGDWVGDLPEATLAVYDALFDTLVKALAVEPPLTVNSTRRLNGPRIDVEDRLIDKLDVIGWGNDGRAFIVCPYEREHTTDSNGTDTAYFPAGTGGYASGHFVCLHGHCRGRDDFEFEKELGLVDNEFDDFEYPADADVPVPSLLLRRELRQTDSGMTLATVENLEIVLEQPRICGWHIGHDTFREAIMIAPLDDPSAWRELTDSDYTELRIGLGCTGFLPIGREMIRDVVFLVAVRNSFDSAQLWLQGQTWDGVPRVRGFCSRYLQCAPGPYADAVSEYIWSALAGRVLRPGAKADMMPVLVGTQGLLKSTAVEVMVPDNMFYGKVNLAERDTDLSRKMRGKLVMEVAELRGLQTRDNESIKDFISQTHEEWTPKFKEFAIKYARRFLFIGTTNQVEFLADPTGERRWLPLKVLDAVDVAAIERDRLQLWAEGAVLFKQQGILWAEAERLAKPVHEEHRVGDLFAELVEDWLVTAQDPDGTTPLDKGYVTTHEVLAHALGYDMRQVRKGDEMRVAAVLRSLGFERRTNREGDALKKVWVKTSAI